MRVFVFGVLLAHTLNAQVSDTGSDGTVTALNEPAPLITPGSDALAESDLLNPTGDAVIDDGATASTGADATATSDDLPVGTADVIVDTTSTDATTEESTLIGDTFGAGETEGPGVDVNGSGFNFPTASDAAESTVVDVPEQATDWAELGLGEVATTTLDTGAGAEATPLNDLTGGTEINELFADIPTESPIVDPEFGTEVTDNSADVEELTAATPAPDADAIELSDSESQTAEGDETAAAPEATDPAILQEPGTAEELIEPEATESSSTVDLGPTPLADAQAGGVGAAYADDEGPGTWTGDDAGNYDGQDIEDEDCPASCYEEDDDEAYGTNSTASSEDDGDGENGDEDEDYSDSDETLVKRIVRWISRRALDGSNGGFAAFSWPIDQKDKTASFDPEAETESCGDDLPEWLYESAGKKPDACPAPKAKCPAKCYEYGTGPKPYPVSSISGGYETYSTPAASSIGGYSAIPEPSAAPEYSALPESSAPPEYSAMPESNATPDYTPYPVPDESTTGYYENTVYSTQTTFVTLTTTVAGGYQDSAAEADYTGDTLASICPKTCDPFNPAANKCDITSSCTTTGKGKYYCACRAGFRASAWNAKDFSKQFKFPDQPYVYTAEGVVCDKVCSDQTCTEVLSRPQCQ
ncbi:hypothetical protein IQ06DRAFT_373792 [Phaeosphaeriaceae sp. SRC1lsM3a]|nr:hypothetical protein IQ06DRAFT_373792 [Stagonospora sp. SRC1lsM3a]